MKELINNYKYQKIKDRYFLTTDHGSYCILSEGEFTDLKKRNINQELKEKLEKKQIILNDNNLNETIKMMRRKYNFLFSGTSLHTVIVTSNKDNMDKETSKKIVDFIFQTPSKEITIEFKGNDPLLNWEVVKYIIGYANGKNIEAKKNLRIKIITTLNGIDEEKMNYLIDKDVFICTFLDGPDELHNYNRKFLSGNNHKEVVKWIKLFNNGYKKKNSNNKVEALITLTKKSLEYSKEIIDEYVKLGLNIINLKFLNKIEISEKVWPLINYSEDEFIDFWKNSINYIEELKKQGKDINDVIASTISNKINGNFDSNNLEFTSPYSGAIGQLVYDYNGNIYPSDEARIIGEELFLLGNVDKDIYKEILTSDKVCTILNASIIDQFAYDSHAFKPYYGVNPILNYISYGNTIGNISQSNIFNEQFNWIINEKFINQ